MASARIVEVALVGVCLPLERYVIVSLQEIAILHEAYCPLCDIPQVEEEEEHLTLLQRVDELVVFLLLGEPAVLSACKDDAADVDGVEPAEGYVAIVYYEHNSMSGTPGAVLYLWAVCPVDDVFSVGDDGEGVVDGFIQRALP